ncbi:MAG: creatininase family protein [Rhodobacteraceae bacterium]|nr:creatininase family protein [Paracoccaceae bacterium]
MTQHRHWQDFRAPEFAVIDPMRTIAILPIAAIEQHGPHLPVGTDTIINQGLLDMLADSIPAELDVRILPLQAIGKSNEHLWAPGTLTLSAENALRVWQDIGLSVARAGVRKLLIVNSHGGNADLISILARELRVRAGMLAVRAGWGAFGMPDGLYSEQEQRYGIHGGDVETSLVLHFRPEMVDMSRAEDFRSTAEKDGIPPTGPFGYGWIASDLNPHGVVGEANLASADKGHRTAGKMIRDMLGLLHQIAHTDLDGMSPVIPLV